MLGRRLDNIHPYGVTVSPSGKPSRKVAADIAAAAQEAERLVHELVEPKRTKKPGQPARRAKRG
jgi:hypothetical protein